MEQRLQTGIHDQAQGFTNAYFAHPDEIMPFMEAAGFATWGLIGCEDIVAGHEEKIKETPWAAARHSCAELVEAMNENSWRNSLNCADKLTVCPTGLCALCVSA